MSRGITIIGGGLTGLALGIAMRREGVATTILEAGHYPRHKVCGEFLSGRGRAVLRRLGLESRLSELGAREAETVSFWNRGVGTGIRYLPDPAMTLSRWRLDAFLAHVFQETGGDLVTGERRRIGVHDEPGIVWATGRVAAKAPPSRSSVGSGWRLVGLKAHAVGVDLAADLDMHFGPGRYVGMCGIEGGRVNVCGLFWGKDVVSVPDGKVINALGGEATSALYRSLANAEFDPESIRTVAALDLRPLPRRSFDRESCCLGDTMTMIPPVTGNGMSMALESAELAVPWLVCYARGDCSWAECCSAVGRSARRRFQVRLFWARWLQWSLMRGGGVHVLHGLVQVCPELVSFLFRRTR